MKTIELKRYRWERSSLYLVFDEGVNFGSSDALLLDGAKFNPADGKEPSQIRFEMSGTYIEDEHTFRVRFLIGENGNPVPIGTYQLLVLHKGGEYPISASSGMVNPSQATNKRDDILLHTRTSSYYKVVPFVENGFLHFSVSAKGMPETFKYRPKNSLKSARKSYLKAIKNRIAVSTYNVIKRTFPTNDNKILFTSDSRTKLGGNMEPLYLRMKERGLIEQNKVVFSFCEEMGESRSVLSYFRLAYHLATSRIVFCDDYQPYLYKLSFKPDVRLIQLWHACGHFKTVGGGRIGTLDATAPFTYNHRNYTDVIVASDNDIPVYGEAFGIPDERVKALGIPRHDLLLNEEWQNKRRLEFKETFPEAEKKQVIVFAPTFRGPGKTAAYYDYAQLDLDKLAAFCREHSFFFIFKMHPFIQEKPAFPREFKDVLADGSAIREINDVLPSTDILITDYSSVVYEAALLNIPTLYYAYDLTEYIGSRDFYEPFEEFVSGKVVKSFDSLLDSIAEKDFDLPKLEKFRTNNFKHLDGGACDRIIDHIVLPAINSRRNGSVRTISLSDKATAINAALDTITEDYVLFIDKDAKYDEEYASTLASAFVRDSRLGAASGLILNHAGKPLKNEVDRTPSKEIKHNAVSNFGESIILPYGVMYRMDVIRNSNLRFDEQLDYCRDELFAIRYMEVAPRSIRINKVRYQTGLILDESGVKTPQSYDKRWYFDSTQTLLSKLSGNEKSGLSRIAQYGMLYLTIMRFKSNQGGLMKMAFESEEETETYLSQVGEVMCMIEDEVLFCRAAAASWERYKKIYLAQLRNPSVPLEFEVRKNDGLIKSQVKASTMHKSDAITYFKDQNAGTGSTLSRKQSAHFHSIGDARSVAVARKYDALLYFKGSNSSTCLCRIREQHISVISLEYTVDKSGNRGLDIYLSLARCFPIGSYTLKFRINNNERAMAHDAVWETPVAGIVTFFDHYACRQDAYHAFIPLLDNKSQQTISLFACFDGFTVDKDIEFGKNSWANKLSTNDEHGYWYFDGFIARSREGRIILLPANENDRTAAEKSYLDYLRHELSQAEKKAVASPNNKKLTKKRDELAYIVELRSKYWATRTQFEGRVIWTYNDKSYKAGDNAEYALRYAAQQNDGIEKVYFINPDCKDAKRLADDGYTILDPSSIEGGLYALNATIVHMTHVPAFLKLGLGPSRIRYFRDLLDAKVIRMYHGFPITRSASYAQIADNSAGVVIGTEYERQLYTNADNGFSNNQILSTGMPRYDDLIDDSRKQLLFAPTWRPALVGKSLGGGESAYNPKFKNSPYFKLYEQAMNDERLLSAARKNGYKIKMFLHPKMCAQTVDFSINDVVDSLSCTEDIDYVTIMRQSDLMVTDYSSVQFDFAYMRKPVVYFHEPALPYWRLVDFDYEGMGFGEVCRSVDELVETLIDYMETNCALKEVYSNRVDNFFLHSDHEAGKRLYEADIEIQRASGKVAHLNPGDIKFATGL